VEPETAEWSGENPVQFVLSENLHRRHLTSSQRAAVAAEAIPLFEAEAKKRMGEGGKEAMSSRWEGRADKVASKDATLSEGRNGRSAARAAELLGVGEANVTRARRVKKHAPKLFQQVKAGEKTVCAAIREADEQGVLPQRERKKEATAPTNNRAAPKPRRGSGGGRRAAPSLREQIGAFETALSVDLCDQFRRIDPADPFAWADVVKFLRARLARCLGVEL